MRSWYNIPLVKKGVPSSSFVYQGGWLWLTPLSRSAQNMAMRMKMLKRLRLPTNSRISDKYVPSQSPLKAYSVDGAYVGSKNCGEAVQAAEPSEQPTSLKGKML